MHSKLAQALNLLDIGPIALKNEKEEVIRHVSPLEHAAALFSYLDLAGYLTPDLLQKAVTYLAAARPFSCPNEVVLQHLTELIQKTHQGDSFNVNLFFEEFCLPSYFQVDDVIDLIVFLQQTAFDRKFGEERDKLCAKPWFKKHAGLFQNLAMTLGVTTPLPPMHAAYCGTAIMGAASTRVVTRIDYFNKLSVSCGEVWALSGKRELSEGLDELSVMEEVARTLNKPVTFIEKGEGPAKRKFLDGITETMMVNCLLQKHCAGKGIALIDSGTEAGHWRVTTAQGAEDIAKIIIQKIQAGELIKEDKQPYRFMVIAEQPYAGRMARQVQRAFNAEIQKKNLVPAIQLEVEGVGPGISGAELQNDAVLTRLNSDLAALMAERFNDARLRLQTAPGLTLRNAESLMSQPRDATYAKNIALTQATSITP